MLRKHLYLCAAVGALMVGAPGAFAQVVVNQTSTNSSAVTNAIVTSCPAGLCFTANTITVGPGGLGLGASVGISASGAVASTSATAIDQIFNSADYIPPSTGEGFGNVTQAVTNNATGTVINLGTISIGAGDAQAGSSVSVGASGAVAALAITGIGGPDNSAFAGQTVGNVDQTSTPVSNAAYLVNRGSISAPGLTLSGDGASASISATGAQASVSVAAIDASGFGANTIGTIGQTVSNTGFLIWNSTVGLGAGLAVGDLSGDGASASVSATGAVASVSVAAINSPGVLTPAPTPLGGTAVGNVTQAVTNVGVVDNTVLASDTVTSGAVSGDGARLSVSATGAQASVSLASIDSFTDTNSVGDVTQGISGNVSAPISNTGAITNTSTTVSTNGGDVSGTGASVSVSATGAVASVSVASISSNLSGSPSPLSVGTVGQVVLNSSTGAISNNSTTVTTDGGAISGNGASVSVGATGAVASVSVAAIGSLTIPDFVFNTDVGLGGVTQAVTNLANVTNTSGTVTTDSLAPVGAVSGDGAGVSVSATGAQASVSLASIDSNVGRTTLGTITQGTGGDAGAPSRTLARSRTTRPPSASEMSPVMVLLCRWAPRERSHPSPLPRSVTLTLPAPLLVSRRSATSVKWSPTTPRLARRKRA